MSVQTIRFTTPEKLYGLLQDDPPHSTHIGAWKVSETYQPNVHDSVHPGLGSYRITVEREVSRAEDVWPNTQEVWQIAEQLDMAWCYVFGEPMRCVRLTVSLADAPPLWDTNIREVEHTLRKERGDQYYAVAQQCVNSHWLCAPFLPLKRLLEVREAYTRALPVVRDLVELHIQAYQTWDGRLFLLSKALEIAGAFYAGTPPTRAARNSGLEKEMEKIGVKVHLTQSIEWLFNIANERFDVRHVWDKDSPGVVLHPRMTAAERADFEYNANLVLRAFVCERFGVDVILAADSDGPT